MIADAVGDLVPPGRGLRIVLSAPNGEELAQRTENAMAGIVGGIAILGGLGSLRRTDPAEETGNWKQVGTGS